MWKCKKVSAAHYFQTYDDIKIIDFGLAQKINDKFGLSDAKVGSPYFTAPDVIKGYYGKE